MPTTRSGEAPPAVIGWVFFGIGAFIFICLIVMAALKFKAARCIKRRSSRVFCMIVAGFSCLEIPYGTALGVLSLIVLSRNSVKNLFSSNSAS